MSRVVIIDDCTCCPHFDESLSWYCSKINRRIFACRELRDKDFPEWCPLPEDEQQPLLDNPAAIEVDTKDFDVKEGQPS